jgi:hypothetical protein
LRGTKQVVGQWQGVLKLIVADPRAKHPHDWRSDYDLQISFLDHLVAKGQIEIDGNAYILFKLV